MRELERLIKKKAERSRKKNGNFLKEGEGLPSKPGEVDSNRNLFEKRSLGGLKGKRI